MSKRTESKTGLIYSIVTTFLVIVLAAVMVLEFATPYKPSNGFKKVVVDQEQTEQLPNDKPNDEGKDKDKDEKPNEGKDVPAQTEKPKDSGQEDPTQPTEQGEQDETEDPEQGENPEPEDPTQPTEQGEQGETEDPEQGEQGTNIIEE